MPFLIHASYSAPSLIAHAQDTSVAAIMALMQAADKVRTDAYLKRVEEIRKADPKAPIPPFSMDDNAGKDFAGRFLKYAEAHPMAEDALRGALLAVQTSRMQKGLESVFIAGCKLIEAKYTSSPKAGMVISAVGQQFSPETDRVLAAIVKINKDRKLGAKALRAQIDSRQQNIDMGERLSQSEPARKSMDSRYGTGWSDAQITLIPKLQSDITSLQKALDTKFAGVLPSLSIGSEAPEIAIQNVGGGRSSLKALRGKVVVLDIWATWCGPCKAMIPHERKMVDELVGKPFQLVSISADEKLDTLTNFLKSEYMPWTHWWNGSQGGLMDEWNIKYFPTIYVIDKKGVIRFKDIRDEDLSKAVKGLLAE